jgi:hypothetical protein
VPEPKYVVEAAAGQFELRRYETRVVAETRVKGSFETAGNEGFRRLAGYIFGKNKQRATLEMTAPVAERAANRKLAMTAPVSERAEGDEWVVAFTMPEGESLQSLPQPEDARVVLRELSKARVAVVRFSGRWTDANMHEHTAALRAWLQQRSLKYTGDPEVNRYDPPWIPWFMRRNEVWLALEGAAEGS